VRRSLCGIVRPNGVQNTLFLATSELPATDVIPNQVSNPSSRPKRSGAEGPAINTDRPVDSATDYSRHKPVIPGMSGTPRPQRIPPLRSGREEGGFARVPSFLLTYYHRHRHASASSIVMLNLIQYAVKQQPTSKPQATDVTPNRKLRTLVPTKATRPNAKTPRTRKCPP
jgi:hypothetical protein